MKITKKSVAGSAFNFIFVFGLMISLNGSAGTPPVGSWWEIVVAYLFRIGMPVCMGVVGAMFVHGLLAWYEQTRNEGTGKAGDDD